ncbi:tetratricopeptide repeat protein [Lacicoccus alkaliphilus]|uniref:Tfp pilus assembly protein PilF n=1 Tax=Lacicoccus alkaliphilus DSM 16010 TaxID=1123231 RepID=A0A1M7BA25_9BACL|nr:tetratricopeptide repeat protein [Salinicoccus alkaliphilus]SHL51781.1 Tfp pilus assembly protein PilF [Salinicoccus alkaliphilus DSM 16010]
MQEMIYQATDSLNKGEYPEEKLNAIVHNLSEMKGTGDMEALFIMGDALVSGGLHDYAEKVYLHLYHNTDHDDEVIAYLTDLMITDNRLDEALSLINSSKRTPVVLMLKAEIFQQLNMNDIALKSLFEAKSMADDPIIDFAIAELYFHDGDLSEANRHYQLLINHGIEQVNQIDVNLRLAEINMNLLNLEDAKECFAAASDENYSNDDWYREALLEYQLQDYDEAIKLLEKVLDNEPYYMNAYILLMNIYETQHDLPGAVGIMERYLTENDSNPLAYFHLGRLHFRTNQPENALEYFKKAIELDQDYDDAYLMLFETLLKMDAAEEIDDFLGEFDHHTLSGESLYLLAKIHAVNEDDEKAMKYYSEAAGLIGDSLEFHEDYYYYLSEVRDPLRRDILEKLLEMDPSNIKWQDEKERLMDEDSEL